MTSWKKTLISEESSIRDAIRIIAKSALQIALVINEKQELLGTITDGDIRRAIINGLSLESPATNIMFTTPKVVSPEESREKIITLMKRFNLRHIPIVNHNNKVVGLEILLGLLQPKILHNPVVLMAGGLGSRLKSLTKNCPKPMLQVGNRPILETIINSFIEYGFHNFYISVNYQAEKIKDYFGNGKDRGINIEYITEKERLGTAGALSLLPEKPRLPIIVMNGDLLTKVNFKHLLDFHEDSNSTATMCVREYDFQVPYGVINVENSRIKSIEEKPTHSFFVNAGIYVLNPDSIDQIPKNKFFDMPELFNKLKGNSAITAFPIREYWMDIGQIDDFHKANGEFYKIFS